MAKGKKPSLPRKAIASKIRANSQAAKSAVKDATKDAQAALKLARKKQRETLRHTTGMDIREFRHAVSALKKAGIVSKRTDARQQEATNYMRRKVRDFFGVVTGTEQAVAVPKETRAQYKESGAVKMKGRFALVPKEDKDQIARIRKGMIEITTPTGRKLPSGKRPAYMREVILPFKMTHMHIVAEKLANDPTLDGLKEHGELFGARLFGHNIAQGMGWTDARSLGEAILINYKHLLSGQGDKQAVRYFRLYKFWNRSSTLPEGPESEKDYITDYRAKKLKAEHRRGKFKGRTYEEMRNERLALKKARKRDNENAAQREARLTKQRERQSKLRANPDYKRPDKGKA